MISARARFVSVLLVLSAGCQLFMHEESPPPRPLEPELVQPQPSAVVLPEMTPSEPPPPEPTPSEPAIRPTGEGHTRGKLSKRALAAGIESGMPAFQGCYARALARRPGLRGSILVNFVVAPDGTVPYAAALEQGTDLPEQDVIECVLDEVQKLHFEPPVGGRAVATYPLSFAPQPSEGSPPVAPPTP